MSDNDIDSIIEQLKNDSVPSSVKKPETPQIKEELTDDNVGDYVYRKSSELVESTLGAVQSLKDNVLTGSDPKEIAALSQLINSATKALDQLNKINLQNKQSKTNVELKKMEITANSKNPKQLPQTTNVLIATRDEILSQLFDKTKKTNVGEVIDGDYERLE